jgi:multidrug efflux pump subunit AcrA (membrane-fusion protein)
VEVLADSVTEENLGKVAFDSLPEPLPPIGELAEVTIALPELPASPVVPNASIQTISGKAGVWKVEDGKIHFVSVRVGASDLDGSIQVLEGLQVGDQVVAHSASRLTGTSRVHITDNPAELLK